MKESVLVTGANGFIGSHLSEALVDAGFRVFAMVRKEESKNQRFNELVKNGDIILIKGDITNFDFDSIPKIDYIYSIAGRVSVWGKKQDFRKTNIGGNARLLELAAKRKVKCFTFLSSVAVYGFYGYQNLPEEGAKKPFKNQYSLTKLETEKLVEEKCNQAGIDYLIVRPGNVYGEYDYTSSYDIYTRIKNEKMLISANGKYQSCFVYVKNLADAIVHLSTNKKYRNTDYNIADNNKTLKEVFTEIATEFNVKPKFKNFPAPMAKFVARTVENTYKLFRIKKTPLITRFTVYQNCADYSFSTKKLESTGYARKYSDNQGIKNTVNWINSL